MWGDRHTRSLEQLTQLSLVESYCRSLLTYATGALTFLKSQLQELNAYWNTVYRTISSDLLDKTVLNSSFLDLKDLTDCISSNSVELGYCVIC